MQQFGTRKVVVIGTGRVGSHVALSLMFNQLVDEIVLIDVNTDKAMSSSYKGFPTPGFDYNSYPRSRTYTFGINVAF